MRIRFKNTLFHLLTLLIFVGTKSFSQPQERKSGSFKKYQDFGEAFHLQKSDTLQALPTAQSWLKSAKLDGNKKEQLAAYQALMHVVKKEYRMIYADSLLNTALETADPSLIGGAYLTIGTAYYNQKNNTTALEYYVKAATYIAKTDDAYLINKIKYALAQTNYHLGYYDEAIALFTNCMRYFKDENETAYTKALHGLALSYHHNGRYDLSSYNNQLGIKISEESDQPEMIQYFKNSEGFNKYMLKEYNQSLALLTKSLPTIVKRKDYTNQALTLLYIGKCWLNLQDETQAIDCFLSVDQLITDHQIAHPYLLETYELLVQYFKKNDDTAMRLKYADKLIDFEKILKKEYKYLTYKIHKEGSIQNLKDTASLNNSGSIPIERNEPFTYGMISISVLTVSVALLYFFWYRRKQAESLDLSSEEKELEGLSTAAILQKIKPDMLQSILLAMEALEKGTKFTAKGYCLRLLADDLDTNSRYTSAVILQYRNKKIRQYINDLKIEHLVRLFEEEPNYRNFTYEALGQLVGFGSTQIFTKAFKEKMGKSPIDFIHEVHHKDTMIEAWQVNS